MSGRIMEVAPSVRREAETWLDAQGVTWGPGRSFMAWQGRRVAAVARLVDPSPGDGHHREHVRELRVAGEPDLLAPLAAEAVAAADRRTRIEASCAGTDDVRRACFASAGLELEAELPEGWREGGELVAWQWWGRAAAGSRSPDPPAPRESAREPRPPPDVELAWSDAPAHARTETSPGSALARFIASLAPGRAYPPGTLLSEAERLETSRRGALARPWLLALREGEVVGALALERPPNERSHVARIHLDVAPAFRRRGIATLLARRAVAEAARFGVARLEADPRAGNAGACGAVEGGGLELAGVQRGAWRMRAVAAAWDEDVRLYSARAASPPRPQPSDGGSGSLA